MMRNDTINFWNSAEQFLLGGIASELAVTFAAWRCRGVATQHEAVSSFITLIGTSKGND
jgi:hypothetical protein